MTEEGFARALVFVGREEGLRLVPYRDLAGLWTVGYGHRCKANQRPISRAEAELLLESDLIAALSVVERVPGLNDDMLLALASFVFNVGAQAFEASTLRKRLLAGHWHVAADEFLRWVYVHVNGVPAVVRGLVERRARERFFFLQGVNHGLDEKSVD